jgi:1-deoxy-D-xylulose-5-phosphate synthase
LHTALTIDGPVALRYPRGAGFGVALPEQASVIPIGQAEVLTTGERVAFIGYGYGTHVARLAGDIVAEQTGITPTVVNARFCKPLDERALRALAADHDVLVTVEDHVVMGGFGSAVMEALQGTRTHVLACGLPDRFIDHGKRDLLLAEVGVSPQAVAERAISALRSLDRSPVTDERM